MFSYPLSSPNYLLIIIILMFYASGRHEDSVSWFMGIADFWNSGFLSFFLILILNFLFCIGVSLINNVVIVSGEQWRDLAIHVHGSILFQIPLPSRLAEFHVLHSRSLLVIHSKYSSVYMPIPNSPTIPPTLATINPFSKSVNLFLFCKFTCSVSFQIPHIRNAVRYFSVSVWLKLQSVWLSLGLFVLPQMAWFHYVLWGRDLSSCWAVPVLMACFSYTFAHDCRSRQSCV